MPDEVAPQPPDPVRSSEDGRDADQIYYVGIGASAGGLEALRKVLRSLNKDLPATYLVAQHMSPTHASMLVDILRKESPLEVHDAEDGVAPQQGVFYITPPNANIMLEDGVIRLSAPTGGPSPKPSIDVLFSSLAEDEAAACVGIVLSGTGTDGTAGLMEIRSAGGLTIAQEPSTCQYDGMPVSAIESGAADLRLPPEEIGNVLHQLVRLAPLTSAETRDETALEKILSIVERTEGVRLAQYKRSTIERRLQRRMSLRQTSTVEDYLTYLREEPGEARELVKDIFISVTEFFRDRGAFDALLDVLKELFENRPKRDVVRIWVPGCSTGQEAYTVAILCEQARTAVGSAAAYQIFATDISARSVETARKGRYGRETAEQVVGSYLEQYFSQDETGYQVRPLIRDRVLFSVHDLAKDPPFARLDLITCRNVLIYFNTALQDRVIGIFNYALADDGYLMLGRSESAARWPQHFSDLDTKNRLYRKLLRPERPRLLPAGLVPQVGDGIDALAHQSATGDSDILKRLFHEKCVSLFVPVAIAIDRSNEILFSRGDIGGFTEMREGRATLNLLDLIAEDIRPVLRALIYRVRRTAVSFSRSEHTRVDAMGRRVKVEMDVHDFAELRPGALLISLRANAAASVGDLPSATLDDVDAAPIIQELESELTSTRENLQTVVEELETTNEELQSSNEELQSSNEELQATNEELQTTNEELQSSNEELRTLNEEMNAKALQLEMLSSDLQNIERGIGIPLLVLGRDLRVRRYSADIDEVLRIHNLQTGDPESSLLWRFDRPDNFSSELAMRIQTHSSDRMLVRAEDRWFDLRITPYMDLRNTIEGLVLSFVDVSELRDGIGTLRDERERALDTLGAAAMGIMTVDSVGVVQYVNRLGADILGWEPEEAVGNALDQVMPLKEQLEGPYIANVAIEALRQQSRLRSDEPLTLVTRDGEQELLTYSAAPIEKGGRVTGVVVTFDTVEA